MNFQVLILQIDIAPELRPSPNLFEDWMLAVFFVTLLSIAYVRIAYQRRLQRLFSSLLRIQILRQVMREELVFSHRASVFLFFNFVLLAALIIYMALKFYGATLPAGEGLQSYGILAGAVAGVYFGKLLLNRFIRRLLSDAGLIREYLFEVFLVNKVAGLFAIPLALAMAFLNIGNVAPLFIAALFLGLAMLVYRMFQGLLMSATYPVSPVYIILYLCTLELLPFFVLVKALERGLI